MAAGVAVAQHRPVFPAAFPQLVDDLHVFLGDFVARVVLRLARKADALGGAVEIPGDHIPADTPAGQMIECRKPRAVHARRRPLKTEIARRIVRLPG